MILHIIVDYSFLYYKYKFQLDSGKMRRLTAPMNWKGAVIEKDISQIYYSIKEIEGFRRRFENAGHDVFVSVCFDMPSNKRKELFAKFGGQEVAEKYKSNRVKHLSEEDFENIQFVEKLLGEAGYNTYRIPEYESDDIIAHLIDTYNKAFDFSIIYTPDLDLLAHISSNVSACRYKALKGYTDIGLRNFSDYIGTELKCQMPYNALILYKSTVGDKSDCIDGIKKFGPKAFDKLVNKLNSEGQDWNELRDYDNVEKLLVRLTNEGYFTEEQGKQALLSLLLVRPLEFKDDDGRVIEVEEPNKQSTKELRSKAYLQYSMESLVE